MEEESEAPDVSEACEAERERDMSNGALESWKGKFGGGKRRRSKHLFWQDDREDTGCGEEGNCCPSFRVRGNI